MSALYAALCDACNAKREADAIEAGRRADEAAYASYARMRLMGIKAEQLHRPDFEERYLLDRDAS